MLCASATRAPSTWLVDSPRSCSNSSTHWAMPVRARRMPLRLQAAARVHGQAPAHRGLPRLDQCRTAESIAEPEVLVVDELDAREAVVHFGDIDVGRSDAGHRVRLLRRLHRRWEGRHVGLVLVHHAIEPEADAPYPHRPVGVAVDDLFAHQQQRGGAVALGRAVVEAERFDHGRRVEHVLNGDLVAQLRLRIAHTVVVVLDRHHRQMLTSRRGFVEVAVHVQREVRGRDDADRVVPRHVARQTHPLPERAARRRLAHLVGTGHEHDVEHAAGHAVDAVADGVVAGRARVLDACHRHVEQAARVGEDARREPVGGGELAEPRGVDVGSVEPLVDAVERFGHGHRDQVLDAELEVLTEVGHARSDDRDAPHCVTSCGTAGENE